MEYCQNGTIGNLGKLLDSKIQIYTVQLFKVVKYLHQRGIVHRAIDGEFIFIATEEILNISSFTLIAGQMYAGCNLPFTLLIRDSADKHKLDRRQVHFRNFLGGSGKPCL